MQNKKTSAPIASLAGTTLRHPRASRIAKALAASALAQQRANARTGRHMERLAARVMNSRRYNANTKALAASVLSQSVNP